MKYEDISIDPNYMLGASLPDIMRRACSDYVKKHGVVPSTVHLSCEDWQMCWHIAEARPTTWFVSAPKDGEVGLSVGMFGREVRLVCDTTLMSVRECRVLRVSGGET